MTRPGDSARHCALAAALVLLPLPGLAQDVLEADGFERVAPATRTAVPPVITGRLDDPAWAEAVPLTGFVQSEPREGSSVSQRTEVRVLYDDDALYIGAWLYDMAPQQIVPGERRRDASLANSDGFLIILDTYRDGQSGFVFGTNPSGIEYDGQVTNEGRGGGGGGRMQGGAGGGFNINWDGNWSVATSRDEAGWYAEFRIPFATLRYAGGESQTWGLNMARYIRRNNEEAYWSPLSRQFDLFRLSQAGTLAGLDAPAQRLITAIPYVLGSAQRQYVADDRFHYPTDVGGDLKLGVTRSLTLDLTVNTDFAQVEVDEEQVDLTRFRLFFPEKRPFFLENAGLFDVGSAGETQLFFSRRIGIGPDGRPVPIRGGARLTGRAAGIDVGLLNIWTGGLDEIQDPNRYTVARLARELPNRSRIGGIFTSRAGAGSADDHNRAYAMDGRLGIGDGLTFEGMAAASETPGATGRQAAYRLAGDYRSREWFGRLSFDQVGESFNPEVGFVSRSGFRQHSGILLHYFRTPGIGWLRELRPHVSYGVARDFAGFKETERLHVDTHIAFENGAFFSPAFDWVLEGLREPFAIAPDVVVAPGTYSGWQAAWRFNTNEGAPVSLRGGIDVGSFLSGSRRGGSAQLNVRHGVTWAGELGLDHHRIDLAEGDFDVTLVRLRLAYSFSPSMFVQSLVQYSDQADQWSGNLRFGWINAAGTGLYVVYNERQGIGDLTGPLERGLIIKYTHFFDFTRT
jgi:hypothetical protein